MPKFKIDEVYKTDESNVYIANFQNGYPNNNFGSSPGILLQNDDGKKTFATQISDLIYAGEESKENLGKTLILVRNKSTGKVRLIETKTIDLKPEIKSDLESAQSQDNSFLALGRKFGSKKHKKALEQVEKLRLNANSVTEQMKNVSKNVSEDQIDISTLNKTGTSSDIVYFPECNREATKVENVYPPNCLLTDEQFEKIYEDIELLDTTKLLPFLQQYIKEDSSKEKKALALYAHTLLSMSMLPMRDLMSKQYNPCPSSETLSNHVKEKFFTVNTAGRRARPLQYKDMAICHALIAIFIITNFKFDLGDLAASTKQALTGVITKITLMSGQISRKDGKVFAILKLPLPKPKVAKSRNK